MNYHLVTIERSCSEPLQIDAMLWLKMKVCISYNVIDTARQHITQFIKETNND